MTIPNRQLRMPIKMRPVTSVTLSNTAYSHSHSHLHVREPLSWNTTEVLEWLSSLPYYSVALVPCMWKYVNGQTLQTLTMSMLQSAHMVTTHAIVPRLLFDIRKLFGTFKAHTHTRTHAHTYTHARTVLLSKK